VALGAADVCVPARQGELGALIVVKGGGGPVLDRVAIRAQRHSVFVFWGKLFSMRVIVARFTILGCSFELCLLRTRGCLMAIATRYAAVRPLQRKFRFRMVEASNIDPGTHVVAGLAAH